MAPTTYTLEDVARMRPGAPVPALKPQRYSLEDVAKMASARPAPAAAPPVAPAQPQPGPAVFGVPLGQMPRPQVQAPAAPQRVGLGLTPPPQEDEGWLQIGRRLAAQQGPAFKQAFGGMAQSIGEMGRYGWAGFGRFITGQPLTEDTGEGLAEYGAEVAREAQAELQANAPRVNPDSLKGYAYDIANATIQMAPMIGVAIATKNPAAGLTTMGGQVWGQKYGEARQSGRTPEQAAMDAGFYTLAETIPEIIPLGILLKPGGHFLGRTLKAAGAEGLQEMFTESLQRGYDAGVIGEDMTWGEAWAAIQRAGIVGAGAGGTLAAVTHPLVREPQQPAGAPTASPAAATGPGATTVPPGAPSPAGADLQAELERLVGTTARPMPDISIAMPRETAAGEARVALEARAGEAGLPAPAGRREVAAAPRTYTLEDVAAMGGEVIPPQRSVPRETPALPAPGAPVPQFRSPARMRQELPGPPVAEAPAEPRVPAQPSNSWVIVDKTTGEAVMETFDRRKVDALRTERYEAVPIGQYLGDLNRRIADAGGVQPPTRDPQAILANRWPSQLSEPERQELVAALGVADFAEATRELDRRGYEPEVAAIPPAAVPITGPAAQSPTIARPQALAADLQDRARRHAQDALRQYRDTAKARESMESARRVAVAKQQSTAFLDESLRQLDQMPAQVAPNRGTAQILRATASGLTKQIEAKRGSAMSQQTPTQRRARILAGMAEDADRLEEIQTQLNRLADAHEQGTVPPTLAGIKSRKSLEDLRGIARRMQYRREGYKNVSPYPSPVAQYEDLSYLRKATDGLRGAAKDRQLLLNHSGLMSPDQIAAAKRLLKLDEKNKDRSKKLSSTTRSTIESIWQDAERLQKAGITEQNYEQAVRDLESLGKVERSPEEIAARERAELERSLIGAKIPGYFSTPEQLARRVVDEAEIKPGMRVLEPSAGHGAIADIARETGAKVDVIEINQTLRSILERKGYTPVETDFTAYYPGEVYDRIVMNPPFEQGQDAQHVRHAYDLLKPGGRVVAIMGEGTFFRSDKAATGFRQWLDEVGGESEKLPVGSFAKSLQSTGTATRLVTIDKPPAEAAEPAPQAAAPDVGLTDAPRDAIKVSTGMRLRSKSGRELSPIPTVNARTSVTAKQTIRRLDEWLVAEARKEAQATGDGWLLDLMRGRDPKNMSTADRELANDIIFGRVDGPTEANVIEDVPAKKRASAPATAQPSTIESGERLTAFLRKRGGIKETATFRGELRARDITNKRRPGLISTKGMGLDDATLAAWEAGFLPGFTERPNPDALLNALERDLRGEPVVRESDQAAADEARETAEAKRTEEEARRDIRAYAEDIGEKLNDEEVAEIIREMIAEGIDAETAVSHFAERLAVQTAEEGADATNDPAYDEIPFEAEPAADVRAAGPAVPGQARPDEAAAEGAAGAPAAEQDRLAAPTPTTEQTPLGEQFVVPGAEQRSQREVLERRMAARDVRGRQAGLEGLGLFDPGSRETTGDLFAAQRPAAQPSTQEREDGEPGQVEMNAGLPLGKVWDWWLAPFFQRYYEPLGRLPSRTAYLGGRREAQGEIDQLGDITKDMQRRLDRHDPETKEQIYQYLTTPGANPSMITNPEGQRLGQTVKRMIDLLGREMVWHGLLEPEQYQKYKDRYLPRIYLKFLLEEGGVEIGAGNRPKVPRAMMGRIKKRKDLSRFERDILLGEIKDPAYLAARAFGVAAHSISVLRFLDKVANRPEWIYPPSLVNWNGRNYSARYLMAEAQRLRANVEYYPEHLQARVTAAANGMEAAARGAIADPPDPREYQQVPDTKRYGTLRGLWVKKEIYDDLVNSAAPEWRDEQLRDFHRMWRQGIAWWKASKTSLNLPAGHVRNHISGSFQAQLFGGVPVHRLPDLYFSTLRDMATDGPAWRAAKRHGVRSTSFAQAELMKIHDDFKLKLTLKHYKHNLPRLLREGLAQAITKAGDAYSMNEQFWKTLVMKHHMAQGMPEGQAADLAHAAIFDYSLVPNWLRALRENLPFGAPFATFMYKALPLSLEALFKRPWAYWPYAGMVWAAYATLAMYQDLDDDEIASLKALLPEWLAHSQTVFLPFKDQHGRWLPVDLGYYFPFGGWLKAAGQLGGRDVLKALDEIGMMGNPGFTIPASLWANKDGLGREIWSEGDPAWDQFLDGMGFVLSQFLPPTVTQGKQLLDAVRGLPDRYGNPQRTPAEATARLFGVTTQPLDVDVARLRGMSSRVAKIREAEDRAREIARDQSLTESAREQALARRLARIQTLQAELGQWQEQIARAPR